MIYIRKIVYWCCTSAVLNKGMVMFTQACETDHISNGRVNFLFIFIVCHCPTYLSLFFLCFSKTVTLFVLNIAMFERCVGNRAVWVFICNFSNDWMLFGKYITFLHFHLFSVLFYEWAHLVLESFVLFCNEHDE